MNNIPIEICIDRSNMDRLPNAIYVFGVCRESKEFVDSLPNRVSVIAFVDNNKAQKEGRYCKKEILSREDYVRAKKREPIVVCTNRYAREIVEQFESDGLEVGKDILVWDQGCVFHESHIVQKFVSVYEDEWKDLGGAYHEPNGLVLMPFDNRHSPLLFRFAFCANYLAEKYRASIAGFCKMGFPYSNISTVVRRVYRSFHVEHIIDTSLSETQTAKVRSLFKEIWPTLTSWADWDGITIDGVHFGTTMQRDFFRRYLPTWDMRSNEMKNYLLEALSVIVFWFDFFELNLVHTVLMDDGTLWDGYIRDIAISKGIPVYAVGANVRRLTLDFAELSVYQTFDNLWNQLSEKEKRYGIEWAKNRIDEHINGNTQDVALVDKQNFAFANPVTKGRVLKKNDKLKIVLCTHSFEEDCYWYGKHIFDSNYFSWLAHVGELSNKYTEYEWYLKKHPSASMRDKIIVEMILDRYPNLIELPDNISPIQLKQEGVEYALTVCGSIGHEYPAIGIQVINAGLNPHSKFDFCFNPHNEKEYDDLIKNLKYKPKKTNLEELYQFYALKYLYYNWDYTGFKEHFFRNPILNLTNKGLRTMGYELSPWIYEEYLKELSDESFREAYGKMEGLFQAMDDWSPTKLYRKGGNEPPA